MAKKRKRRKHPEDEAFDLNMTPMIDVVFQLLIFFMLSMHFKAVEGKLLSQLPKDKGLAPEHLLHIELNETRIVLCAGGDIANHLNNKGKHEKEDKPNDEIICYVERTEIGKVYKTEKFPTRASANRAIYRAIGAKTRELHDATPSYRDPTKRAPVILDADSEVPYEHVIGAVNACKEVGIDTLEFVGNPRFEKYYGSYSTGQFERNKKR